jgi:hypothetical protein
MDIELSVFGIVVVVAVQSAFYLEMHQNEVFSFFLKLFLISIQQNDLKIYIFYFKKKKIKFEGTPFAPYSQTHP